MLNYKKIKDIRNMILIKKSGLFDNNYYKKEYPEAGKKALQHYYYEGYKDGNNPSGEFDNDYYLIKNPDVYASDINPLLHYILSGKNEGRRIKKAYGITIPKLYKTIIETEYSYSVSLKNSEKKRITIILEKDNKNNSFIIDILKKCYDNNYICRIVYEDYIEETLSKQINKEYINNIELVKWNKKYLLEVYTNEVFICNNYNILISLLHTNYITKPIYFYIDDKKYSDDQMKYLSLLIDNNYIKCFGNETNINKYQLDINNKYCFKEKEINICLVFDKFCIEIFDILQLYISNNIINKYTNLFYHSTNFYKTISLANDKPVPYIQDYNNMDLIINFRHDTNLNNKEDNTITITFNKTDKKLPLNKIDELFSNNKQEILSLGNINLDLFEKEGEK